MCLLKCCSVILNFTSEIVDTVQGVAESMLMPVSIQKSNNKHYEDVVSGVIVYGIEEWKFFSSRSNLRMWNACLSESHEHLMKILEFTLYEGITKIDIHFDGKLSYATYIKDSN